MAKFFICHKRLVGLSLSFFTLVFLVVFSVSAYASESVVLSSASGQLNYLRLSSGRYLGYGTADDEVLINDSEYNFYPSAIADISSGQNRFVFWVFYNPFYRSNYNGLVNVQFDWYCDWVLSKTSDFSASYNSASLVNPRIRFGQLDVYSSSQGSPMSVEKNVVTYSYVFPVSEYSFRTQSGVTVDSSYPSVFLRAELSGLTSDYKYFGSQIGDLRYSIQFNSSVDMASVVEDQTAYLESAILETQQMISDLGSGSTVYSLDDVYELLDDINTLLLIWNNNIMLLDDMAQDLTYIRTDTANIYSLLGQLRLQLSDIATHVSSIDSKLTLSAQDNLLIINYLRDISSKMDLISDFAEDVSDSEGVDATSNIVNRQVGSANDMITGLIEDSQSWSQGFIDVYHGGSGGSFGGSPGSGGAPGLMSALFTALHNQIPFTAAVFSVVAGAAIMIAIVRIMRGW